MAEGIGRIDKMVKISKLIHKLPNFFIRGMKNMRAVLMDLDPRYFFSINISGEMVAFFDDGDVMSSFSEFVCRSCPEKSRADN